MEGAAYHVVEQSKECLHIVVPAGMVQEQIDAVTAQVKKAIEDKTGAPFAGKLEVLRNTQKDIYLVYPPKPENYELTDDMLENVAGGGLFKVFSDAIIIVEVNVVTHVQVAAEIAAMVAIV